MLTMNRIKALLLMLYMMVFGERAQAATFVRVAVGIFIGLFLIGAIYNALDQTGLPAGVQTAINDTLDQSVDAFGLLVVSLIVMAAVVIMGMLGQKGNL